MIKWIYKTFVTIFMGVGLLLAGCAVLQNTATSGSSATATSAANGRISPPLSMSLALGTLNLEGTDLAVTPQQAATLLPLWQAADRLATSGSANSADLEAAFKRIQAAMTTDQLQAIQSMDLSSQNMLALAQKLAIAMPAGANSQPPAGTPGPGGPPGLQGTPMPGDPPGIGGNGTPAAPGVGGGFETVWYQAVINLLQQKTQ
jgi:hypothetical protein